MSNTLKGLFLLIAIMCLFIFVRHKELLLSPNENFIGDSYDGFKNYSTLLYHVKYDSTYTMYQGMNYPHGEHVVFTDMQPIFANTIKFVSEHIFDLSDKAVGIHNLFLLFSILLCSIFCYLVFRKFDLPPWYAAIIAFGMALLAPQTERFGGHYALSYSFIVPMLVYLYVGFEEHKTYWRSLLIGLTIFIIAQLHFYYFGLAVFFIGFYVMVAVLSDFSIKKVISYIPHLIIQVIIPFIILKIWLSIGDAGDRPAAPYGFLAYIARWEGVFLPEWFRSSKWLNDNVVKVRGLVGENISYVGLIATLYFIYELVRQIIGFKKFRFLKVEGNPFLQNASRGGFLILLFSLGLPFLIPVFEPLLEYTGPLKQFRGTGRFAWVFYFLINFAVFYILYQKFIKIENKNLSKILFSILLVFFVYEAIDFNFKKKYGLNPRSTYLGEEAWDKVVNPADYQGIIPVPYYHIGSENVWLDGYGKTLQKSLAIGIKTGIPLTSVFMSRTSLSQTIMNLEFVGEPYRSPSILEKLPNQKDFLICKFKKENKDVWYYFDHLMYGLDPIYEDEDLALYRLPYEHIKLRLENKHKNARNSIANKTWTASNDGYFSTDSIPVLIHKHFDESKTEMAYRGQGCVEGIGEDKNVLFEGPIPNQQDGSKYVFSVWQYMGGDLQPKNYLLFEEYDPTSDWTIHFKDWSMSKMIRSIDGNWALIDIPYNLGKASNHIRISVSNTSLRKEKFYLDEFEIREQGEQYYQKIGDEYLFNNRWYPIE